MSWRPMLSAVTRISLVLAIALSGMAFNTDDAEARRGGKFRSSKERATSHDDATTKRKSDEEHDAHGADGSGVTYVPGVRVRSREAARGDAETATDASGLPVSRRVPRASTMSVRTVPDIDVPGCPTGMICTVCLAGCQGDIGGIVDAQTKTPPPLQHH